MYKELIKYCINWYEDNETGIYFFDIPDIVIRYIYPYSDKIGNIEVCKKPFVLKKEFQVMLKDFKKDKQYNFLIPSNYCWDGATIPKLFWQIIGTKNDPKFVVPSLIHDVLCENHNYVGNDRYFADRVFERLLYVSGVSAFNRWLMFHVVDNFQKFCNWKQGEI